MNEPVPPGLTKNASPLVTLPTLLSTEPVPFWNDGVSIAA
jgi:hypothetical protein